METFHSRYFHLRIHNMEIGSSIIYYPLPAYQEKYTIPKLPPQTIHIKAANMGHHMITLNTDWALRTIRKFLNNNNGEENLR